MKKALSILFIVATFATLSKALYYPYSQVYAYSKVSNGISGANVSACAADSDGSVYFQLSNGAITKVDSSGNSSTLLSPGQWTMNTGNTSVNSQYGFSVDGGNLEFSDTSTNQVFKVNKTSGNLSIWAYQTDIKNATGSASCTLTNAATAYNGAFYVYDSVSASILKVTDAGVSVYVAKSLLSSTAGAASAGLAFDSTGRLLIGNASKGVYRFNGTAIQTLLTAANITGVIGGSTTTMSDMVYGDDGKVYLAVGTADKNIVFFDPSNPTGTLANVFTTANLKTGVAGSANVYQMTWYNNNIAFNIGATANQGFYTAVPEPATMGLLAVGGLFLRRGRK